MVDGVDPIGESRMSESEEPLRGSGVSALETALQRKQGKEEEWSVRFMVTLTTHGTQWQLKKLEEQFRRQVQTSVQSDAVVELYHAARTP